MNKLFEKLFILDIANNHFGDLRHTLKIINEFKHVIKKNNLNATIKFQFRDLDTFIHKDYVKSDHKYVRRFLDTRFSKEDFQKIFNLIKKSKIKTSCTPFDEKSVDLIERMKFDFLKIASVSSQDFSLLERASKNKIPKIISTGGLNLTEIDKIYSFFKKRNQIFGLMHCISIYPSENKDLQISFIKELKERYPEVPIGWSTHELPQEFMPSVLALGCGAQMFERHIGINSKKYKLNNYSSTPKIFNDYVLNFKNALKIMGDEQKIISTKEKDTLRQLQRGVYSKKNINKNDKLILNKNVYLAFPLQKNQLSAEEFKNGETICRQNYNQNSVIKKKTVFLRKDYLSEIRIRSLVHKAKALLNKNKIFVTKKLDMEISHHEGIENFEKVGCFLLNIINKEYAQKILVMLPGQRHPAHKHYKKKESFIILFGTLELIDKSKKYNLKVGDIVHLSKQGTHSFRAGKQGCIFEEISTTSFSNDSFYKDKTISKLSRDTRKTYINRWI